MEKINPDVKQAILWTREAWNVGVSPKTIVKCWRTTGILPAEDIEVVEQSNGDMISVLAALLTEFAVITVLLLVPDLMEAQEILDVEYLRDVKHHFRDVHGNVPTASVGTAMFLLKQQKTRRRSVQNPVTRAQKRKSRQHQIQLPVTLEARACMAKIAGFFEVNSAPRGLARFVAVSMEMQSELDKTVVTVSHQQAVVTDIFKAVPKTTTISSP